MSQQPLPLVESKKAAMTSKALLDLLHRHYIKPGPMPGGVFIPECGINGAGSQSRADALYVGFTSTSGRLLVGHELKVSRSDWLRELDKVGKADFWADNCHQWWIVAPGPEVAPKEELPAGWGLLYPSPRTKTRMQVVVKAQTHTDRNPSWTAVRSIMARLDTLRATHDARVEQAALEKARQRAEEEQRRRAEAAGRLSLTPEQAERLQVLDRLEQLLGSTVAYSVWGEDGTEKIGADVAAAAVRLALSVKDVGLRNERYAAQTLEDAADRLLKGLAAYADARAALLALTGNQL